MRTAICQRTPIPARISTQPIAQSVSEGQTAEFSIVAYSPDAFTYQWYKNSVVINGATAASYTTPATVAGDDGALFKCILSNDACDVSSDEVTLTVASSIAPVITDQPDTQYFDVGQTKTFSVTAIGTAPLSYQWQRSTNGGVSFLDIGGATSSSYTTPDLDVTNHNDQYHCVVSNAVGAATSAAAQLFMPGHVSIDATFSGVSAPDGPGVQFDPMYAGVILGIPPPEGLNYGCGVMSGGDTNATFGIQGSGEYMIRDGNRIYGDIGTSISNTVASVFLRKGSGAVTCTLTVLQNGDGIEINGVARSAGEQVVVTTDFTLRMP